MSVLLERPAQHEANMPGILSFPLDMKFWSIEEFDQLLQTGILTEDYELMEGVLIRKMAQNYPHRLVMSAIIRWLVSLFGIEYHLSGMSVDFPLPDGTVSRLDPDITILAQPEPTYDTGNPLAKDAVLLVEVSHTTLTKDTTDKARIYAQSGVQEYWVADVSSRQMIVYREPSATGYNSILTLKADAQLATLAYPDAKIRVGDLFPPAESQN